MLICVLMKAEQGTVLGYAREGSCQLMKGIEKYRQGQSYLSQNLNHKKDLKENLSGRGKGKWAGHALMRIEERNQRGGQVVGRALRSGLEPAVFHMQWLPPWLGREVKESSSCF